MTSPDYEEQRRREAEQRRAAIGRRADAIERGHLGPVVKRWINADIIPIADNLRRVARLYLEGDMQGVALALGSPTSALSQRERPLRPLMEWSLRGTSKGRGEPGETTHAEDLALAFMGTLVPRIAASREGGVTLSAALSAAAESLRDTVHGQFVVGVQGAKAMQRVRQRSPQRWHQRRSLQRISAQLAAQVKPRFLRKDSHPEEIETVGNRKVLRVTDYSGELRRLEFLREPDALDWEIMDLCWQDPKDGSSHPHRSTWLAFAAMLLSLSQQTGGWFEVADKFRLSQGRKRRTKMLLLSDNAHAAIARDVERWVSNGFLAEPMLVPPVDGDWLTVRHRKVTGQRPPKGLVTQAEGSFAWEAACLLSQSPWRVNPHALPPAEDLEGDTYRTMKAAAHRRLGAGRDFYLPVNMDFRGRVYYRTPWVTPQSDDFGKSLLCFPPGDVLMDAKAADDAEIAVISHLASLYGLDKAPLSERIAWFITWSQTRDYSGADSPATLRAHMALIDEGRTNSIPVQLDGTCNGLQHLSALFRDEDAAVHVNLGEGGPAPADIYGAVAREVDSSLNGTRPLRREWAERLLTAGIKPDRTLCKGPVMVLPYGGTLEAIRLNLKATVLSQLGVEEGEVVASSPWNTYTQDNYGAFSRRPLADHPLFNSDISSLATLVYGCITPAIPRAMSAMSTLQQIGSWVGDRALSWQTGPKERPLWVVQAKAKSARKQVTLKGYHLPDVIRRLTLTAQTNEIDPRAHRTGIVANFVHSLDAEHLARTVHLFKSLGGTCIGSVHDCVMARPSEVSLLHGCLREAFADMYSDEWHPLDRPVKLLGVDGEEPVVYGSWREIAEAAGTTFPEMGSWNPDEVRRSQWFFS